MKEFLKQHEEFIDKAAMEVMSQLIIVRPPMSPDDSAAIASISYKQALAMLDAKLALEQILNKTKFLMNERIKAKNSKNDTGGNKS